VIFASPGRLLIHNTSVYCASAEKAGVNLISLEELILEHSILAFGGISKKNKIKWKGLMEIGLRLML
jgi:hypothetical protein